MPSRWGYGSISHTRGFSGRRRHWSRGRFRCRRVGWLGVPPVTGFPHPYRIRMMPVAPSVATGPTQDRQMTLGVPVAPGPMTHARVLAKVDAKRCNGCGTCASVCPAGAVTLRPTAQVDPARCMGCGLCVNYCPSGAISLG